MDDLPEDDTLLEEGKGPRSQFKRQATFSRKLDESAQMSLEWKNIDYKIVKKSALSSCCCCIPKCGEGKETHILHNLSGRALPGRFMAIMGASGSGKTTLLNILSHRLRNKKSRGVAHQVEGKVTVNGLSISSSTLKKKSAYVMQEDALLPYLTVEETLSYAARLQLGPLGGDVAPLVRETMDELGLTKVRHSLVGNDFVRGLSGGEKRRTTIALSLLSDPRILFLDEPTSGLDAKTALSIVQTLYRMAHEGQRTILCTIHQPRATIFSQFDDLYLLAGKGRPVYVGEAAKALGYFSALGHPCPIHENPADFFIDLVTEEISNEELREQTKERVQGLIETFTDPPPPAQSAEKFKIPRAPGSRLMGPVHSTTRWLTELLIVSHRSAVNLSRDSMFLRVRFIQCLFMAVLLGLLYLQMDNTQSTITDRTGLLFFILINGCFQEALPALAVFGMERLVFYRERSAGLLRTSSYFCGRLLTELPLQLAVPALFFTIIYFLSGLQAIWWHYGEALLVLWCAAFCANSGALMLGALFPVAVAGIMAPIFIIFNMLFAGFFVNNDNIPNFLEWIKYISFIHYGFMGLVNIEFNDLKLTCTKSEYITVTDENGQDRKVCPITDGSDVVKNLGLDEMDPLECIGIMLLLILFYRTMAYLALRFARPRAA